jgi:hypothetical protein
MSTAPTKYTNTRGAAAHLACSASYLEKCRVAGGGPKFIKIGRAVRYTLEDLDAFARAHVHDATAEYSRSDVSVSKRRAKMRHS